MRRLGIEGVRRGKVIRTTVADTAASCPLDHVNRQFKADRPNQLWVPARVTIHTDTRRRAIQLDKLTIEFKQTAPSRLYWAGRPAMRIVQALHWLKDTLTSDRSLILNKLTKVLADPVHGAAHREDLLEGFNMLPIWMQSLIRELPGCDPQTAPAATPRSHSSERPPSVRRHSFKQVAGP